MRRLVLLVGTLAACGRTPLMPRGDDTAGDDDALIDRACGVDAFAQNVLHYREGPSASFTNPQAALGPPDASVDRGAVSLGTDGVLQLGFGDCVAGNSGDDDGDLRIYARGADLELTVIGLVPTAESRELLASPDFVVVVGHVDVTTHELDLDARFEGFDPGELTFSSVVLAGDRPGADIDAVELLAPADPPT
jgi:hypothetical protein